MNHILFIDVVDAAASIVTLYFKSRLAGLARWRMGEPPGARGITVALPLIESTNSSARAFRVRCKGAFHGASASALIQNARDPPSKLSVMEVQINIILIVVFVVYFIVVTITTIRFFVILIVVRSSLFSFPSPSSSPFPSPSPSPFPFLVSL